MSFPQWSDKYAEPGVMSAASRLEQIRSRGGLAGFRTPDLVILSYQPEILRYLRRHYRTRSIRGLMGAFYLFKHKGMGIGVLGGFGVGAPVVGVLVEDLAALGVNRVVSLGLAAGLQPDLGTGALVVCDEAIRDEGTSHHYLPPARRVTADPELSKRLASSLEARTGLTWSLDAPYRETAAEIQGCQAEGVLTVDMEAAALFAVGQSCGIRTGAVFVISDHLDSAGWRQGGDESRVHKTLHTALDTLIRVVA